MNGFTRILTTALLVLAALVTVPVPTSFATPEVLPQINPIVLDEAWSDAMEMCEGNQEWEKPEFYILIPEVMTPQPGWRLLGTYEVVFFLGEGGRPDMNEMITIYFTAHEQVAQYPLFYEIIVHENLHSCWVRRGFSEPGFFEANPDSEKFVRDLLGQEVPEIYNQDVCILPE